MLFVSQQQFASLSDNNWKFHEKQSLLSTMIELGLSLSLNFSFIILILGFPGLLAIMDFEKSLMFGKHFLIGTVELPPYIEIRKRHQNGTVIEIDGFVHQIIRFLSKKFSFTFEYIESTGDNTGSCINNTCNGLIGMLIRREIDFIATGLAITLSRSRVIDFTFPFESDPINLLVPYPRKNSTLGSILDPFRYKVWIMIVVSLIVCAYVLSWFGYFQARWFRPTGAGDTINSFDDKRENVRRRGKIADHIMFLLSVLVNPGYHVSPECGEAFRVLVAGWCLSAIVISNSYNQSIKSFLMMPTYKPVIGSLEELTESSEYSFVVKKYSSIWANMIEAETGPFAKMGDILRNNPENSLETLDDIKDLVINKKRVLGQFKSSNLVTIEEDLKTTGECRLFGTEKPFDELRISFGIPKNSHIKNHFLSHEIMWLKQSGLLEHWKKSYWPRKNRCSAPISTQPSSKNEKLTFNYLSGAFLLLAVGLGTSFVTFVAELFTHHYCRRAKRSSNSRKSTTSAFSALEITE